MSLDQFHGEKVCIKLPIVGAPDPVNQGTTSAAAVTGLQVVHHPGEIHGGEPPVGAVHEIVHQEDAEEAHGEVGRDPEPHCHCL